MIFVYFFIRFQESVLQDTKIFCATFFYFTTHSLRLLGV